jgi:hypothetical protein
LKAPENLSREDLWRMLGEYACHIGDYEGIFFTSNPDILKAETEFREKFFENGKLKPSYVSDIGFTY